MSYLPDFQMILFLNQYWRRRQNYKTFDKALQKNNIALSIIDENDNIRAMTNDTKAENSYGN